MNDDVKIRLNTKMRGEKQCFQLCLQIKGECV